MENLSYNQLDFSFNEKQIKQEKGNQDKERILEKLADINSHGIAYTILGAVSYTSMQKIIQSGALESILKYGILGQTGFYENGQTFVEGAAKEPITATNWKNNVRSHKNTLIFFNIMGRGFNHNGKKVDVDGGRIFNPLHESNQDFLERTKKVLKKVIHT